MSLFTLYYHSLYSDGLDRTARFPVDRYRLLADRLAKIDVEKRIKLKEPRLAKRSEILLIHEIDYVDRFMSGSLTEKKFDELV